MLQETDKDRLILNDLFSIRNKPETIKQVCLYKKCLKFYPLENDLETPELVVNLNDLIGSIIEEPFIQNDKSSYLILNLYQKDKSKRKLITIELAYSKFKNKKENYKIVNKWHKSLQSFLLNENHQKPFLVFINPNSGSGKASSIFFNHISKIFNLANIRYQVIDTQYPNHAKEIILKTSLESYRAIIVVSGDGLVYEVYNGLLSRPDWQTMIKIPVAQIPAGSANGLASTIAYLSGEEFPFPKIEKFSSIMAFNMTKFKPHPIDLISVQLHNDSFVHSFMNIEWGMVADVDYESEQFRFLGGFRFVLGALRRALNLRIYNARVSFLPIDEMKNYKPKDKSIHMFKNEDNLVNTRLINENLKIKYKYLVPLNEQVPSDWILIEDEFVFLLVVNLPLMGVEFFVSPESKFDDESMMLTFVRKGVSKIKLLQLIDDAAKGKFLEHPYLEHVKVKAFRLEPLADENNKNGNIMIDGERVEYGPIQGEILPKFARVLAKVDQN